MTRFGWVGSDRKPVARGRRKSSGACWFSSPLSQPPRPRRALVLGFKLQGRPHTPYNPRPHGTSLPSLTSICCINPSSVCPSSSSLVPPRHSAP